MMDENEKIIIAVIIGLILVGGVVLLTLVDIPIIGSLSVKSVISKNEEVVNKEAELINEQNKYNTALMKLEDTKVSYDKEKNKYEAISDETIKIIEEANTKENYSIEYMWIKLGNYAKRNNLELIMVEPNNNSITDSDVIAEENVNDKNVVAEDTNSETSDETEEVDDFNSIDETAMDNSEALKISVTGQYIDLSDFVFEVENDEELRFKLDNISMELVTGEQVRATFDVQNIIVNR